MKPYPHFRHAARLGGVMLCLTVAIRGEPVQQQAQDEIPLELKLPDGDVTSGFFVKRDVEETTFFFRLKVAPIQVYRLSILWLTDEQARLLKIDKTEVLKELASLASSNKPEDIEELRRSLVFEKAGKLAPEKRK